jgi:hypothetical protein
MRSAPRRVSRCSLQPGPAPVSLSAALAWRIQPGHVRRTSPPPWPLCQRCDVAARRHPSPGSFGLRRSTFLRVGAAHEYAQRKHLRPRSALRACARARVCACACVNISVRRDWPAARKSTPNDGSIAARARAAARAHTHVCARTCALPHSRTLTYARTHARAHAHMHARILARARTHTCTHAHAHTRTRSRTQRRTGHLPVRR